MPLLAFENVPILPYTWLLEASRPGGTAHCGGPLWPDWGRQTAARHCRRGRPVDVPPAALPPEETLTEPIAWSGAIVRHFGHQIAEFSTRILPTLRDWPEAVFAFGVKPESEIVSLDTTPRFFTELLAWFGVPPERVRIVSRPMLASRLLVAPQGEQFGALGGDIGPTPDYLDAVDEVVRLRLATVHRRGTLYVSRAAQRTRFAGEAELERALARAGVEIFRPENFPLQEQLRRYAGAERLLFAEGSALHGLQLLGRGLGDVCVLTRRAGSTMAAAAIRPRTRSLEYLDFSAGLVHTLDPSGRPGIHGGLAVLDERRLVGGLETLGIHVSPHWDATRFRAACDNDAREWISRACSGPSLAIPGAADTIRTSLAACGFAHLAPEVEGTGRQTAHT
jgi:hypothetical protein